MTQQEQQIYDALQGLIQWREDLISNSKRTDELDELTPVDRSYLLRLAKDNNSKRLTIQGLIDEIAQDLVLGNVPVEFVNRDVDYNLAGTTIEKLRDRINTGDDVILSQGTLYYFRTRRAVLTNGTGFGPPGGPFYTFVIDNFILRKRIEQNNGQFGVGSNFPDIGVNDIVYLNTVDNRSFEPVEFDLGDIGAADINTHIDTSGPYSTPNTTTVLFNATQGGVEKSWWYQGNQEEIGVGFANTALTDYRELTGSGDVPSEFQETFPIYDTQLGTDIKLDNHEGRYYPSVSGYGPFDVIGPRANLGKSFFIIDTTGQTAFPFVNGTWGYTLDGTSGEIDVNIDSFTYTIEFDTDIDTTIANFITNEAVQILGDTGMVVSQDSDRIVFYGFASSVSLDNTQGDLAAGSVEDWPSILINSPKFEAGLRYVMNVLYTGKEVLFWFEVIGKDLATVEPNIQYQTPNILLNKKITSYITSSAVSYSAFTVSALGYALGAAAKIFYNGPNEPTFPAGWLKTGGVDFEANTDLDIFIEVESINPLRVVYFYAIR